MNLSNISHFMVFSLASLFIMMIPQCTGFIQTSQLSNDQRPLKNTNSVQDKA